MIESKKTWQKTRLLPVKTDEKKYFFSLVDLLSNAIMAI